MSVSHQHPVGSVLLHLAAYGVVRQDGAFVVYLPSRLKPRCGERILQPSVYHLPQLRGRYVGRRQQSALGIVLYHLVNVGGGLDVGEYAVHEVSRLDV